jgi:hypothetical protein
MPATLTPVATSRATGGINLGSAAVAATAGGDSWANTGKEMLYIKNGGVSSVTLTMTFAPTAKIDGVAPSSPTATIATGESHILGPFPTGTYNDANGLMQLTYSGVTSVTVLPFYTGN